MLSRAVVLTPRRSFSRGGRGDSDKADDKAASAAARNLLPVRLVRAGRLRHFGGGAAGPAARDPTGVHPDANARRAQPRQTPGEEEGGRRLAWPLMGPTVRPPLLQAVAHHGARL
jgi:hypothetical protein